MTLRTVAVALALAAVSTGAARAQSINPPIVVIASQGSGTLVIANPTLYPMTFVLEPLSFSTASSGDLTFIALDTARIHLNLSAMSGRIPPRQSIRVFYEVVADSLPSWFAIVASFTRTAPGAGLTIRLQMPQMVYLMQPTLVVEGDLTFTSATYDARTRTLRAHIENHSDKLTRLLTLTLVSSDGPSRDVDAGPLFPRSGNDYVHVWEGKGQPVKAVATFAGFSLTRAVVPAPTNAAGKPAP